MLCKTDFISLYKIVKVSFGKKVFLTSSSKRNRCKRVIIVWSWQKSFLPSNCFLISKGIFLKKTYKNLHIHIFHLMRKLWHTTIIIKVVKLQLFFFRYNSLICGMIFSGMSKHNKVLFLMKNRIV